MTVYRWLDRAGIKLRPRSTVTLSRSWLVAQLDSGATVSAIARRAGVGPCTVWDQLSSQGLLSDSGGEAGAYAAVRYAAGASLETIGHELRASRRRVKQWLRTRGVPIRRPGSSAAGVFSSADRS